MDNQKIGSFIKELRLEKGWSQSDLAEKISVDRTSVSKWENGKNLPDSSLLLVLSEIFDVSITELLLGERDSNNKIEDVSLKLYDERNKVKKTLKLFFKVGVGIVMGFLVFFFIQFFNSVKIYSVTDSSGLVGGLFIKTRDRISFQLNYLSDDIYDSLSLFYKEDEEEKLILNTFKYIFINDYVGYEEYFDFDNYKDIINNLYLRVFFEDGREETYQLEFTLDYRNNKLIIIKDKSVSEEEVVQNFDYSPMIDVKKVQKNICKDNNCYMKVEHNKKTYDVISFMDDDMLDIEYIEDGKRKKLQYYYVNGMDTFMGILFDDESEDSYAYLLNRGECNLGDCSSLESDLDLFYEILGKVGM